MKKVNSPNVFCRPGEKESVDSTCQKEKQKSVLSASGRILLVDDEELLVRLNARGLELSGYTVTLGTDSQAALARSGPGRNSLTCS